MSGGHYDYAYGQMNVLAQNILDDVEKYSVKHEDTWVKDYWYDPIPEDIRQHMTFVALAIKELAEAAHDIEWMMSGDIGWDTLRERCESWKLSEEARER